MFPTVMFPTLVIGLASTLSRALSVTLSPSAPAAGFFSQRHGGTEARGIGTANGREFTPMDGVVLTAKNAKNAKKEPRMDENGVSGWSKRAV